MTHFVTATSLNFRSRPDEAADAIQGKLFLCHPVEILEEPAAGSKFCKVRARLQGAATEGFVARSFLRDAASATREALIARAIEQWHRFERGLGKETSTPFFRFVGEMWQDIGIDLDGKDNDQPWSAAAISFIVRRSGAEYGRFKFAAAHARYIHDSIKRREAGDKNTPFWGFRLHERRPQLGDLVCKWRESRVDFDDARQRDDFKSHCDIVVQIDSAKNTLLAIGGNVSNSVSVTSYALHADDFLAPQNGVFALLANRTDE